MCTSQKNVHLRYITVVLKSPNTFNSNIENLNTSGKRNHPYHPFGVDQIRALGTRIFIKCISECAYLSGLLETLNRRSKFNSYKIQVFILKLENFHWLAYALLYGKLQNYSHVCFCVPCIPPTPIETGGGQMKKLAIQLFVIGTIIATYALPVLARGGPGF